MIEKFAGYAFPKAHSTAYALITYQTAYLKANHPREFLAALLTIESGNHDKLGPYIQHARDRGIEVLAPEMNSSERDFAVVPEGIRFGFAGVKNVGEGSIEAILETRNAGGPFESLYDFACRIDSKRVNRRVIESLIRAGAFDFSKATRASLFAAVRRRRSSARSASSATASSARCRSSVSRARAPSRKLAGARGVADRAAPRGREGAARLLRHGPPAERARAAARAVHELPPRPGPRRPGPAQGGLDRRPARGPARAEHQEGRPDGARDPGGPRRDARHRVLSQDLREVLRAAPGGGAGADQGERIGRARSPRAPRGRDRAPGRRLDPAHQPAVSVVVGADDADAARLAGLRRVLDLVPGPVPVCLELRLEAARSRSSICRATRVRVSEDLCASSTGLRYGGRAMPRRLSRRLRDARLAALALCAARPALALEPQTVSSEGVVAAGSSTSRRRATPPSRPRWSRPCSRWRAGSSRRSASSARPSACARSSGREAQSFVLTYRTGGPLTRRPSKLDPGVSEWVLPVTARIDTNQLRAWLVRTGSCARPASGRSWFSGSARPASSPRRRRWARSRTCSRPCARSSRSSSSCWSSRRSGKATRASRGAPSSWPAASVRTSGSISTSPGGPIHRPKGASAGGSPRSGRARCAPTTAASSPSRASRRPATTPCARRRSPRHCSRSSPSSR